MNNVNTNNHIEMTDEQILSLRSDRHISVTANAGSGKTFVLVKRYQDIINKTISATPDIRIDPSRVVAITFTRKAAGEMHKKVIKAFDEELAELQKSGKNHYQEFERLKRIREGLSYASITTIHSFCSNLLRQFPIEAGVSVNFSEISESENLRLRTAAVINTLEDWLNVSDRKKEAELMLSMFTRKKLVEYIAGILTKVELFEKFELFYSKTDEEIFAAVDAWILKNFQLQNIIIEITETCEILLKPDILNTTEKPVSLEHQWGIFRLNLAVYPIFRTW